MDANEVRSILRDNGVDVWTLIDSAIGVALIDNRNETKSRRDAVVERLYASPVTRCPNCEEEPPTRRSATNEPPARRTETNEGGGEGRQRRHDDVGKVAAAASSPDADVDGDDEEEDHQEIDEEQVKILGIKEHLEDPNQSEDALVNLLQELADMDITFKALQSTDIGRHVNHLRKHPSSEVRRLVKVLVRKWKDLVDEWVKLSQQHGENGSSASTFMADGDSPQLRGTQNSGHHQLPDFTYSPNVHNGSSGSDKNNSEPEPKPKVAPRREPPSQNRLTQSVPPPPREPRDAAKDAERLASARRRLQENYQEAQNAKKQRTIQVMDLQDIPKPKSNFFGRNKGGFQSKHW